MFSTINESWFNFLESEFDSIYFKEIEARLKEEYKNYTIYPPQNLIFHALNITPFEKVKVVILGQDPYHGEKQAMGLAFSVNDGVKIPPSLKNVYKEMAADLDIHVPKHGNLEKLAQQGVLLINATLTVRAGLAYSHKNIGWELFTDKLITKLSSSFNNLVFILWGNFAGAKEKFIDKNKHLILKAAHPSPLSARSGFFGCRHFSKTNNYLKSHNIDEIDWVLP